MARCSLLSVPIVYLLSAMVHASLLQLFMVVMAIAERCTRAVPVQNYPAKKVHVLRRVPATCSNWDKAWAWLTKVDCGTKYRLDYVTVPPREVKQYKLQYVCCDGDTDCKEAENIHSSGFDSTDEKFLAIVLGSTAACVVIIIIIFAVTFYTKKTRCLTVCDQGDHVYASADGEDSQDGNRENEKCQPEDLESETDQKGGEAEYAEIGDARLPRYTDIFKDNLERKGDPFNKATAPPLYSEVPPKNYVNTSLRAPASLHSGTGDDIQIVSSPTLSDGADDVFEGPTTRQHHLQSAAAAIQSVSAVADGSRYYNMRGEKRKKKKRSSSGSQGGSASSNKGEKRETSSSSVNNSSSSAAKLVSRRSKANVPVHVEMMVKSSSASETIGKPSETALTKQKRRSAPPDTVDMPIGVIHNQPAPAHSPTSSSPVSRFYSNNICSVIHEAPAPRRLSNEKPPQKGKCSRESLQQATKLRSSGENLQQKPMRKTSRGKSYENNDMLTTPPRPMNAGNNEASLSHDMQHDDRSGSVSDTSGAVVTFGDGVSVATASLESASPLASEKDSLLRSPSCHSGCGSDRTFEDCEQCSKYDRLHYTDTDTDSTHVYQCLDEVRRECQELRAKLSSTGASPTTSLVVLSAGHDGISSDLHGKALLQGKLAHC